MKITKAEFKRQMKDGSRWTVLTGPTKRQPSQPSQPSRVIVPDAGNERTVHAVKADVIEFLRGGHCILDETHTYENDNGILKVTNRGEIWVEYHPR